MPSACGKTSYHPDQATNQQPLEQIARILKTPFGAPDMKQAAQ